MALRPVFRHRDWMGRATATLAGREARVRYHPIGALSSGGMGHVELAMRVEGRFRRLYALKRLHPHLQTDPDFLAMFRDEARIAGLMRHPNVVGVLDVGEDTRGPYLAMDFVQGVPLSGLLTISREQYADLPVQVCVHVCRQIALGLHAAHELTDHRGRPLDVVHRDLSPQNVIVGFDGSVRLIDFGVAKALRRSARTATGVLKGKPGYMSPEQLCFQDLDRRSDLFSLGVLLFELLSGQRLYGPPDNVADRVLHDPPPDIGELRPEVPPELVELILELLAKQREARPADAGSVAERLEHLGRELAELEGEIVFEDLVHEVTHRERAALTQRIADAQRAEDLPCPPVAAAHNPTAPAPRRRRFAGAGKLGIGATTLLVLTAAMSYLWLDLVAPASGSPMARRARADREATSALVVLADVAFREPGSPARAQRTTQDVPQGAVADTSRAAKPSTKLKGRGRGYHPRGLER